MTTLSKTRGERTYWENRYEEYWDAPFHGSAQATEEFMAAEEQGIRDRLPALLKPEYRVLDAGCGYGRITPLICPLVAEYVGVDFSEKAIAKARATAANNATFIVGDILDVTGEFDVVVMVGISSSLSYRPEVVEHLRTLLSDDGVIAMFDYGDDRCITKGGEWLPL